MSRQIIIFDTTLRDGEQSLQASLSVKEKMQIALALERMKIDIIEVGFPVSSPGDFESVKTIANIVKNSKICALARCVEKDIDTAYQALKKSNFYRIHIFLATSPIHIKTKLRSNISDIIELTKKMVKYARNYTDDVQFSCEDGGRTPIEDLCRVVEIAIKSGAHTINIPDTVGYNFPKEYGDIISSLIKKVPNIDQTILSVHTHNDLGMAVGNAISAIQSGARQVEGTVNGLGERAGNCALEEIIMAIKIRKKSLGLFTNISTKEIYRTSQIISKICNINITPNKAIVGSNAFSHSSGIHQDGIIKNKKNYEIISPKLIGLTSTKLNLTSRSGRAAVKHRMEEMGYKSQDYNLDILYQSFLKLADKKGQVFDYDLESLAFINKQTEELEYFSLKYFNIQSGYNTTATATVTLSCGKKEFLQSSQGNGPIDAVYQAINKITDFNVELLQYQLSSRGHGKDALGQVDILVKHKKRKFHGIGLATDIIESSIQAMINALNNIWRSLEVKKELNLKLKK